MKKKSGNISILVIFVLLASSLLGILSMNFVQQMMKQSAVVNSYYKAYYLSKAGIELWLSIIKYRGVGFEYSVNTWAALVRDNFFSGQNFSLFTSVSGTSSLLSKKFWQGSGCAFPYVLSGGESIIVPLFRDVTPWSIADLFSSWIVYENLASLLENDSLDIEHILSSDTVTFGLLILSGNELYENGIFFKSWSLSTISLHDFTTAFATYMTEVDRNFVNFYGSPLLIEKGYKIYLMLSNTAQIDQSFCLKILADTQSQSISVLPTDTFFLQSQASYGDQRVALDASYAQPIPSFLFGAYSDFN